jgi:hypothetical protein
VSAKALTKRLHEAEGKALDAAFARLTRLWGMGLDEHAEEALPLFTRASSRHRARGGLLEAFMARLPREMPEALRTELRKRFAEEDGA